MSDVIRRGGYQAQLYMLDGDYEIPISYSQLWDQYLEDDEIKDMMYREWLAHYDTIEAIDRICDSDLFDDDFEVLYDRKNTKLYKAIYIAALKAWEEKDTSRDSVSVNEKSSVLFIRFVKLDFWMRIDT